MQINDSSFTSLHNPYADILYTKMWAYTNNKQELPPDANFFGGNK